MVIVEREDGEPDLTDICDGFDNLSRHNLLSYKFKHQSLNAWALEELIGHYVKYQKIIGKSQIRTDDIRLYAISTRRLWVGPRQSIDFIIIRQKRWDVSRPMNAFFADKWNFKKNSGPIQQEHSAGEPQMFTYPLINILVTISGYATKQIKYLLPS